MSNPLRILKTVDKHLTLPAEITLFGRSALALGYSPVPPHFQNTKDVDGILSLAWLQPPDEREDFWRAVQLTNAELEPDGLYLFGGFVCGAQQTLRPFRGALCQDTREVFPSFFPVLPRAGSKKLAHYVIRVLGREVPRPTQGAVRFGVSGLRRTDPIWSRFFVVASRAHAILRQSGMPSCMT